MAAKRICAIPGCGNKHFGHGWCGKHYMRIMRHGDPEKHRTSPGTIPLWIEQHSNYQGDDCLIWPFAKDYGGAGRFGADDKSFSAPRVMCEIANGQPPTPQHEAAHGCGNGHLSCINPKHLRWATSKENSADMVTHATVIVGGQHKNSKLTIEQVREIRSLRGAATVYEIADKFSISISNVSAIQRRQIWNWLD